MPLKGAPLQLTPLRPLGRAGKRRTMGSLYQYTGQSENVYPSESLLVHRYRRLRDLVLQRMSAASVTGYPAQASPDFSKGKERQKTKTRCGRRGGGRRGGGGGRGGGRGGAGPAARGGARGGA